MNFMIILNIRRKNLKNVTLFYDYNASMQIYSLIKSLLIPIFFRKRNCIKVTNPKV